MRKLGKISREKQEFDELNTSLINLWQMFRKIACAASVVGMNRLDSPLAVKVEGEELRNLVLATFDLLT